MPRQISAFRLLAESLRVFLSEKDDTGNDRWPKYKEFFRYLRESLDWSGSEREYRALKQYGAGPDQLVEGLFDYLCRASPRTLKSYLERHGASSTAITPQQLVEQWSSHCDARQVRTDWHTEGWRGLAGLFATGLLGLDERCLCRSRQHVLELTEQAMTDVGRQLAASNSNAGVDDDACLALGERHMGRSLAHFQEQAVTWWKFCPWSALQATHGDEVVGGSMVLPLRPETYASLRSGQISDLDLSPETLQYPSRHLLGEAMVARIPPARRLRVGWISARQVTTIIYQVARLSFAAGQSECTGQPISVMCVGGTPPACERLRKHGYRVVGTLRGFDVPLYELIIPPPEHHCWLPTSAPAAYAGVIGACHGMFARESL